MFLIWAIPAVLLLALIVWVILGSIRQRVRTADRHDGTVLRDD